MGTKAGWSGRVYEDFEVGDVYDHPLGRTVIPADNVWFTLLSQNTNPIHFDQAYAAKTEFGKPVVDSTFTLALVTGQSVIDLSWNVMANLGWDKVRLLIRSSKATRSILVAKCCQNGNRNLGRTSAS